MAGICIFSAKQLCCSEKGQEDKASARYKCVHTPLCPGQPGVNHCQNATGGRGCLDLTSLPCVHSTHICCASSKGILCCPQKGDDAAAYETLFSGGDRTPSSALCAPKDCASICTRGRNRPGPSSLFIQHPADQTLAPRPATPDTKASRVLSPRQDLPALPPPLPFQRPARRQRSPESPRVLHDPSRPPRRAA